MAETEKLLRNITCADVRKMTNGELNVLCDELRSFIYEKVSECGGHLSSNLGAVEATVALCNVFDFNKDKIVFDVGHQCYAYKALTGRADKFDTLRKEGGLSGFPKRTESKFDCYDTGHAGTSVAAAIGIAKARDIKKEDYNVIAFIGDGSFNNGLVDEALNGLRILNTRILIVLNDNGMSISPTVGGMHEILSSVRAETGAENAESAGSVKKAGNARSGRGAVNGRSEAIALLESFNLTYLGAVDGNGVDEMTAALKKAKKLLKEKSVLLHIVTKKGKG
ncbi:MAG: 1-deoxy-D-xylulose-5-phosphate synthase N-terminal domain-containing protein [Candidatus Scatosoma sp.]